VSLLTRHIWDCAGNAQKGDQRDNRQHEECNHLRTLTTYQFCTARTNPLRPVFY
jgi:hypothetical protein